MNKKFPSSFLFRQLSKRASGSFDRGDVLKEIKGFRLNELNKQLISMRIDSITDPVKIDQLFSPQENPLNANKRFPFTQKKYPGIEMIRTEIYKKIHSEQSAKTWQRVFWFIGVPTIIAAALNTYYREKEHFEHFDETFSSYIPYPYLRVRTNKMPFGDDQTLFFNPQRNYDPKIHGPR